MLFGKGLLKKKITWHKSTCSLPWNNNSSIMCGKIDGLWIQVSGSAQVWKKVTRVTMAISSRHLGISHNAPWLEANIQVFQLSYWLCILKSESACTLTINQDVCTNGLNFIPFWEWMRMSWEWMWCHEAYLHVCQRLIQLHLLIVARIFSREQTTCVFQSCLT